MSIATAFRNLKALFDPEPPAEFEQPPFLKRCARCGAITGTERVGLTESGTMVWFCTELDCARG